VVFCERKKGKKGGGEGERKERNKITGKGKKKLKLY